MCIRDRVEDAEQPVDRGRLTARQDQRVDAGAVGSDEVFRRPDVGHAGAQAEQQLGVLPDAALQRQDADGASLGGGLAVP